MSKIIIGIDPDSKAHGVAVYKNGKLTELTNSTIIDLMEFFDDVSDFKTIDFEVHIEDVNGVSAAFMARDKKANIHVKLKMAQSIGMCKQAQIELERMFDHYGVKVVRHKISKQWKSAKSGKPMFERITGWTGRSNEDTRSAAYFGYLGTK